MCGIVGIAMNQGPADRGVLARMADAIRHRGPDGEGFHFDGSIGLGHRRLSIIDLATGDQPIFNETDDICIVYNGEIYNYKELRADLLARGHTLRTQGDTEVIVHLYEDHGVDCLQHLNGMFGFAIWDRPRQRLFVARDRMGEKSVYFRHSPRGFAFASELKALQQLPDFDRTIDVSAMADYLAFGYVPAPKSAFAAVQKLPAAHYLTWEGGKIDVRRYWQVAADPRYAGLDADGAAETFETLLSESIAMRLRSDVPVGAFLSGGVDSSLTVALASQLYDGQLTTFTVGFEETDFDESQYAREIAARYGTDHHEIRVGAVDLDMFDALVTQFDEPFADSSAIPTYYVTKAASDVLKVCISGDAGDELFGGYARYVREPMEDQLNRIPQAVRGASLGTIARLMPPHLMGQGWFSRMSVDRAERYQRIIGVFDRDERHALLRPEHRRTIAGASWYFGPFFEAACDEITARMNTDRETYLPEDILVKVDRDAMLNSLEVRVPLLDHRIVEFAYSLPMSLKIRNGEQKYLLRRLLASRAPAKTLERPKTGFGLPLKHWLRGEYKDVAADLLLASDARYREFLDPDYVAKLFHAHQKGPRDLSQRLWALMWLEKWLRQQVA